MEAKKTIRTHKKTIRNDSGANQRYLKLKKVDILFLC